MNSQETKKIENDEIGASEQVKVRSKKIDVQTEENSEQNGVSKELQDCKQELNNWKDKYIHAQADLDNFQKRIEKERLTWMSSAQAKVFAELLNIVDDFERAFADKNKQIEQANVSAEALAKEEGFVIIYKSLQKMLDSFGVKKMDNYQTFNPSYHEALMQVDSEQHKSGDIVEVLQQGYLFKDHVLRPAKVSVAK